MNKPVRVATPRPWGGSIGFVLIVVGILFAWLLYRVHSLAQASQGSQYPVVVSGADYLLLGGGAIACWAAATVLLIWQRKQNRRGN